MSVPVVLGQGLITHVDDEDILMVGSYRWRPHKSAGRGREHRKVKTYVRGYVAGRHVYLHRFIMSVTDPRVIVDHRDNNPLNNVRSNLRLSTPVENARNRAATVGRSRFKGVSPNGKAWMATITRKGRQEYLGQFVSEEEAARMYDRAAEVYFGEFARTNESLGLY